MPYAITLNFIFFVVNFIKHVPVMYTENHETLLREIKEE